MGKQWTKRQFWDNLPFRRGCLKVYSALDWKPDPDSFGPQQSTTVFAVIVDEAERKIFLGHKVDDGKPSWGLFGGGVEIAQGEKPEEGIFREVLWESGYRIYRDESGKLVGTELVIDQQVTKTHNILIFFAFADMNLPLLPRKEVDEIDEARWFTLPEILAMPHFPYNPAEVDMSCRDYIKQTHVGHIIGVLSICGRLEEFGLQEGGPEDENP